MHDNLYEFPRSDDEQLLHLLDLSDEGLTMRKIGLQVGRTKNAIAGAIGRIRITYRDDNGVGNGTMKPGWWKTEKES